jgi:hypothetical protein
MGFSPRVLTSAMLSLLCLAAPGLSARARAQDGGLTGLGYIADPLSRSPRLLAMGRLQLVDGVHNHLSLWDFAGNPTGIAAAESMSTFEYRPTIRSGSVFAYVPAGSPQYEQQEFGDHLAENTIETWRRAPGSTAYGLVADYSKLQTDVPFDANSETRDRYKVPTIGGAVNGRVPWVHSTRFDYALRGQFGTTVQDHQYNEIYHLPQGNYLGKPTAIVEPPDLFTPDHDEITNLRYGVALSARVTRDIRVAIGYDRQLAKWRSSLEGLRSTSNVEEDRPFNTGQATLVGRLGRNLEFAADGRLYHVASEQFFFWTVSAGPTTAPLAGAGKRLDRDLKGTSLRTQARWRSGAFSVGAGFGTSFDRQILTPWYPTGPEEDAGFNDFLDVIGARPGADTLLLPERVTPSQVEERSTNFLGGGNWQLPGGKGVVGVEYEQTHTKVDQAGFATGPKPELWDIRAGGEYQLSSSFLARAGWNYGVHDVDALTSDNAYRSTVVTLGMGLKPPGARWSADLGFALEWLGADYVDATNTRGGEKQMSLQLRWPF